MVGLRHNGSSPRSYRDHLTLLDGSGERGSDLTVPAAEVEHDVLAFQIHARQQFIRPLLLGGGVGVFGWIPGGHAHPNYGDLFFTAINRQLDSGQISRKTIMPGSTRATASQIERIYDSGQNRVTQERNDFLLPQIRDFVREKKWLNLRPEYQRRLVWPDEKKSLFIESLLMNIPVPPVFLYESDLNRYEVMDGQQRLNAILEFYENNLALTGLETWSVLNGLTYAKCPPRIQRGLDRRRISANVLLSENIQSREEADFIRRTVFERLNTGGQQLNHQELRNSLYSGTFNNLLIELAGNRLFDDIWGIPPYEEHYRKNEGYISHELAENELFNRMRDCEIVLRFFAFRKSSRIKGAVRSILDNCMRDERDAGPQAIDQMRTAFEDALTISHSIFGKRTFQVRTQKGNWRTSQALYDAVMVAVDVLKKNAEALVKNRSVIASELTAALQNEDIYEIIVGRPNTANAIKNRISILHELMAKHV